MRSGIGAERCLDFVLCLRAQPIPDSSGPSCDAFGVCFAGRLRIACRDKIAFCVSLVERPQTAELLCRPFPGSRLDNTRCSDTFSFALGIGCFSPYACWHEVEVA